MGVLNVSPSKLSKSTRFLHTQPIQVRSHCCFSFRHLYLLMIWRPHQPAGLHKWPSEGPGPLPPRPLCDLPPCLSSRPRFAPCISSPLSDHPTAHGHLPPGPRHPRHCPGTVPAPGCCRGRLCGGPRRRSSRQQRVGDGADNAASQETSPEPHHLH